MAEGKVLASPQTVGVNFKIEAVALSGGTSRLEVLCTGGHKLAGAGLRAILTTLHTYFGTTLSAAQVDTVLAHGGALINQASAFRVSANVMSADVTSLAGSLTTNLAAAGSVVVG